MATDYRSQPTGFKGFFFKIPLIGYLNSLRRKYFLQLSKHEEKKLSLYRCFSLNGDVQEIQCIQLLYKYLKKKSLKGSIAFYGSNKLLTYFLEHVPQFREMIAYTIDEKDTIEIPQDVKTVFVCERRYYFLQKMKKKLASFKDVEVISPEILLSLKSKNIIPKNAWLKKPDSIYPIGLPEIDFLPNQDLILIDCPARNMAWLPNGLGYVHNALKKIGIQFQTFDLDVIVYHRYHIHRLFDVGGKILTPSGKEMPDDPWLAESFEFWQDPEVYKIFQEEIEEIVEKLVKARPKILGLSIQACNINFSKAVVKKVKALLPDTIILVGGYSCYQVSIGLQAFSECDYMVIGEGDLTVGPLVKRLLQGERPANLPGVLSRYDNPQVPYRPGPQPQNLDLLEMPQYEWFDLKVYTNYNNYRLTPIIASRGCRWSQCTFCAERFFWRARSAKNVVDEFEWLHSQGCDLFMFNESDLNGRPELLLEICDEIIRRGLKIKLTGQLRIHKKNDRAFFNKLRAAGFVALRFGVDAWSHNTLRLQRKGYTKDKIFQTLKDCYDAEIYTEVNTVIGIPGETEEDIDETIEMKIKCKPYIGRIANINTLILAVGGVYWEEPEKHNIIFRGDKTEIYKKNPFRIPDELWYSTNPYIDGLIRQHRFQRVVEALEISGFDVGAFARRVIEDVKKVGHSGGSARPETINIKNTDEYRTIDTMTGSQTVKQL